MKTTSIFLLSQVIPTRLYSDMIWSDYDWQAIPAEAENNESRSTIGETLEMLKKNRPHYPPTPTNKLLGCSKTNGQERWDGLKGGEVERWNWPRVHI